MVKILKAGALAALILAAAAAGVLCYLAFTDSPALLRALCLAGIC